MYSHQQRVKMCFTYTGFCQSYISANLRGKYLFFFAFLIAVGNLNFYQLFVFRLL